MNRSHISRWRVLWLVLGLLIGGGALLLAYWIWMPPRQLADALSSSNPQWSPDGAYLAVNCAFRYSDFVDDFASSEVCLVKPDLTQLIRLAPDDVSHGPVWSPSGHELIFVSSPGHLRISAVRPGTTRDLANISCLTYLWLPDSRQIACTTHSGIVMIQVATGRVTQLTTTLGDAVDGWAHQGQALVFDRRTEPGTTRDLYLLDLATNAERPITANIALIPEVTVSPDATRIAHLGQDRGSLTVVDLQTGTSEDILTSYRSCIRDISRPQWSHNGRYLAFVAEDGRSPGEVYTVDVATRAVFRLTDLQQTSNGLFSMPT